MSEDVWILGITTFVQHRTHQGGDVDGRGIGNGVTLDEGESLRRQIRQPHRLHHQDASQTLRHLTALASDRSQSGDGLRASRDPNVGVPALYSGLLGDQRPPQ